MSIDIDAPDSECPLVTIITPTYNQANYIGETIESIMAQEYPNIEHIVLNDGSTDSTAEVLRYYSDNIVLVTQENIGQTNTVNKGFSMAHGEYIVVVNSDDPLFPGAISKIISLMILSPKVDVGYPDWNYINNHGNIIEHVQVPEHDYHFMVRHHRCYVGPCAVIRRSAMKYAPFWDSFFRYYADFDYWLRLGLHCSFMRIPFTLASFRVHEDSHSVSMTGTEEFVEEHIGLMEKYFAQENLPASIIKLQRESMSWAHYEAAITSGSNIKLARRHFLKALTLCPQSYVKSYRYELFVALMTICPGYLHFIPKGIRHIYHFIRDIVIVTRNISGK